MKGSFWPLGNGASKRHNGGRVTLLCAAAAFGAVLIAACGSVTVPGSGAGSGQASPAASAGATGSPTSGDGQAGSSQPALCRDAATVTSLEIVRPHGIRVPELKTVLPNDVTVTDPALVRAVARALCALPRMPRGVLSCPAQLLGTAYTLHFTVNGRSLPLVTIDATGCETVTGVGPVRRITSSAFWQVLAKAIGVRPPGPPVFGGDSPGSACAPPPAHITKIDGCPGVAQPGGEVA